DRVRFFLLSGLYRSPLEFAGEESFAEAGRGLERLRVPYDRLRVLRADAENGGADHRRALGPSSQAASGRAVEAIRGALAEDFNVRQAVAEMFAWGREVNGLLQGGESFTAGDLDLLIEPFRFADESLGFLELSQQMAPSFAPPPEISALVDLALRARESARRRGDFGEADRIREELSSAGFRLEDTPQGPRW
ncbi:cysteine--tRNA ligase, partial [mine drainage metagenome]